MLAKKRVVMKKVKKVLKVRNGFVEKDSSRDSAYGLSGLYFLLGFTRTPVIVNVFKIISIELIVPPKYSGQQNPNKRADTRAETWKQSVMILSYY